MHPRRQESTDLALGVIIMNIAVRDTIRAKAVRYEAGDRDTRPWGTWEVLATGPDYALKRITVLPGQRLSLQYHHHRAEHWTIVSGQAEVEIDGAVVPCGGGEHVYIPLRAAHRIRNIGAEPLVFIEVQVGQHLDELDIVRIEDDYGRAPEQLAGAA
jgi:mannose-6-phosphate isomerase-like protein (cupin superfamily)